MALFMRILRKPEIGNTKLPSIQVPPNLKGHGRCVDNPLLFHIRVPTVCMANLVRFQLLRLFVLGD